MVLRDDLGPVARTLYIVIGFVLGISAIANDYHDWPLIQAHKLSSVGFTLINVILIPLALLIIVWGCIGRHREWRIGDDHIRIRLLSLTSWQKISRVMAIEIESVAVERFEDDRQDARNVCWLTITCTDGRRFQSPHSFDPALIAQAKATIEGIKSKG